MKALVLRVASTYLRRVTADSRQSALREAVEAAAVAATPEAWAAVAYQAATDYGYEFLQLGLAIPDYLEARALKADAVRAAEAELKRARLWFPTLSPFWNSMDMVLVGAGPEYAAFRQVVKRVNSVLTRVSIYKGWDVAQMTADVEAALGTLAVGVPSGVAPQEAARRAEPRGPRVQAVAAITEARVAATVMAESLPELNRVLAARAAATEDLSLKGEVAYEALRALQPVTLELMVNGDELPPEASAVVTLLAGAPTGPLYLFKEPAKELKPLPGAIRKMLKARTRWSR